MQGFSLSVEQAEQVVDLCISRARNFWLLPSLWRLEPRYGATQSTRPAEVVIQAEYYCAKLIFDLEQIQNPPNGLALGGFFLLSATYLPQAL
jgi:hypothetical protein